MKIKSEKDFWSGLMFIVVGVAFAWGATGYSMGSSARPGPGYFPFGLGILMALLGAAVFVKSFGGHSVDGDKIGSWAWKPLVIIVCSIAAFGFLLPRLGRVGSLPLLVVAASTAGDEFHWKESVFNAAVLTAGSWLIFIFGLKLTIPVWPSFLAN